MKEVTILLSTYNGEKYLEEQLESITSQKGVSTKIIVRDDGSSDHTCDILDTWKEKSALTWYRGENIGPAQSFMDLLRNAGDACYYAFSDQDDFWLSDKMQTAVSKLESYDGRPALYFCQTELVDKNLNRIDSVIIHPRLTFGESLVYQFVGGCTMVMNRALRDIINKYVPNYLSMHDVWIYDVAQAIGAHVVFDDTPHILYRQHGGNVTGQSTSVMTEWKHRTGRLVKRDLHSRWKLSQEIYNGYYDMMPKENQQILTDFIEGKTRLKKRFQLVRDRRFRCSDKETYHNFQLAVLTNIY